MPRRPDRLTGPMTTAVQVAVVCLAVLGPINYALSSHQSVGPVVYKIADIDGWVVQADAMQHQSLSSQPGAGKKDNPNLVERWWSNDANKITWPTAGSPLEANLNALLGLGATDTNSAFLAVYLLMAALAALAAVRYAVRRRTWGAVLAGSLFGGTLFLQLYFDGAVPVVCGVALLLGLAIVGAEALTTRRWAHVVLVALLVAGTAAALPLFLAPVAVAGAGIVAARTVRRWRSAAPFRRRDLAIGTAQFGAIAVLPWVISPVSTYRSVDTLIHIGTLTGHLPQYKLTVFSTPEWLVQTRSLYDLGLGGRSFLGEAVLDVLIPLLFVGAAAVAFWCRPLAGVLLPLVVASAVIAVYGDLSQTGVGGHCSYCLNRGLDPVAAALPVLLGVAIALLAASATRLFRRLALVLAVGVAAGVGYATYYEWHRFDNGSYYLDSTVRTVIGHLPTGCTVLEGFGDAAPSPAGEEVLVYVQANEHAPGRIGILTDVDDNGGLQYFYLPATGKVRSPYFCTDYRDVLTRAANVVTPRAQVFRAGSVALEHRATPLDVIIDYGVLTLQPDDVVSPAATYVRSSLRGLSEEPLQFVVTGNLDGPAHIQLDLRELSAGATAHISSESRTIVHRDGADISVCVDAARGATVRHGQIDLTSSSPALLVSASASTGACPE